MFQPGDIHLLPPGVNSPAALRAAVKFEQLVVEYRFHELFILWYRVDPANPFAIVLRVPKGRIEERFFPWIDPETRVLEIRRAVDDRPPADPPRKLITAESPEPARRDP
jgi:hypothetical protein